MAEVVREVLIAVSSMAKNNKEAAKKKGYLVYVYLSWPPTVNVRC